MSCTSASLEAMLAVSLAGAPRLTIRWVRQRISGPPGARMSTVPSGDVTLAISPPLERSPVAGVITVAALVGGATCVVYSVWT
jgi:hypothetical protein